MTIHLPVLHVTRLAKRSKRRAACPAGDGRRWVELLMGMERNMKKPYEKPAIIHTEPIEGRAGVVCGKAEPVACSPFGPVAS